MHKLGLAISGGNFKYFWQLGVIVGLWRRGALDDWTYTNGTSSGALLSALLTYNDPEHVRNISFREIKSMADVFEFAGHRGSGIMSMRPLDELIRFYANGTRKRAGWVCWVDLGFNHSPVRYTGTAGSEDWYQAIIRSSTVPVFHEPMYPPGFDGGNKEFIPLRESLSSCDRVIAISALPLEQEPTRLPARWWWPFRWAWWAWVSIDKAFQSEVRKGDFLRECEQAGNRVLVIAPPEDMKTGLTPFSVVPERLREIYQMGYDQAMRVKIPWEQ